MDKTYEVRIKKEDSDIVRIFDVPIWVSHEVAIRKLVTLVDGFNQNTFKFKLNND